MRVAILVLLFFVSYPAFSFPENIRLGYAGCSGCHVSPSGGGVLTGYGRGASAEFMTTFQYEGEGRFAHGLLKPSPDFIEVGGDVRYMQVTYEVPGVEPFKRGFMMQADLELALRLSDELTVAGAYGEYGELGLREFRRHYVMWTHKSGFTVRAGRFFPAYGIMTSDHALEVKKHLDFDQGRESYNMEASFGGSKGEVFVTAIFGKEGNVRLTRDKGYVLSSPEKGFAGRATLFPTDRSTLGLSTMVLNNDDGGSTQTFGVFGSGAINENLYALFQADTKVTRLQSFSPAENTSASWLKAGYQVFRGAHLYGQVETTTDTEKTLVATGGGVQLFPRPHLEFTAQIMTSEESKTTVLMAHYYF